MRWAKSTSTHRKMQILVNSFHKMKEALLKEIIEANQSNIKAFYTAPTDYRWIRLELIINILRSLPAHYGLLWTDELVHFLWSTQYKGTAGETVPLSGAFGGRMGSAMLSQCTVIWAYLDMAPWSLEQNSASTQWPCTFHQYWKYSNRRSLEKIWSFIYDADMRTGWKGFKKYIQTLEKTDKISTVRIALTSTCICFLICQSTVYFVW